MLDINNILISEDIVTRSFCCDLPRCLGKCCVHGISGAPLEKQESTVLKDIFDRIQPYIPEKGQQTLSEQGCFIKDNDGDLVTPLVKGTEECAYTVFENGIAKCSIEQAWEDGLITFRKPISCHLYPIRITQLAKYEALNYDYWQICNPALEAGKQQNILLYRFLKDPLIRKYGEAWYDHLCQAAEAYMQEYDDTNK